MGGIAAANEAKLPGRGIRSDGMAREGGRGVGPARRATCVFLLIEQTARREGDETKPTRFSQGVWQQ